WHNLCLTSCVILVSHASNHNYAAMIAGSFEHRERGTSYVRYRIPGCCGVGGIARCLQPPPARTAAHARDGAARAATAARRCEGNATRPAERLALAGALAVDGWRDPFLAQSGRAGYLPGWLVLDR